MQIRFEQGQEDRLKELGERVTFNIHDGDDIEKIGSIIEAVLFASGEPVKFDEIAASLEISKTEAQDIILKFAERYNLKNTGLEVIILEDNAQLIARAENIEYIKRVLKSEIRQVRILSKPALEILAIVAYNQPVTRNYIEQIRGVDCTYMLGNLMERGYIEEKGTLDVPGRPRLYGTTIKFLSQFGLKHLDELPEIERLRNSLVSE